MEVASECGCAGGGEAVAIPSEPDRSPHCFVEDDLHAPDLCRPAVETRTESWASQSLNVTLIAQQLVGRLTLMFGINPINTFDGDRQPATLSSFDPAFFSQIPKMKF